MNIPSDIILYIVIGSGAIFVILLALVIHLEIRLNRILLGKDAKTLEDSINHADKHMKEMEKFREELESYLKNVEARLRNSAQGIHTIRFNPFKGNGSGGNQSFATSIINEKGDGVVFSSIYTRDKVSVFAKPVENLTSEYELTNEEKEVLSKAKKRFIK